MSLKKFIEKASLYFLEKHASSLPLENISGSLFAKKNSAIPKKLKVLYKQQFLQGIINSKVILSNENNIYIH